jgi:hypothetical protein
MKIKKLISLLILFSCLIPARVHAWSEHPLLARYALSGLPLWESADSVEVKSLKQFLVETEDALAVFLAEHEKWAQENLRDYFPRPEELKFLPGIDHDDIVDRFFYAIRINPETRAALYLYLAPCQQTGNRPFIPINDITALEKHTDKINEKYVLINEGDLVHPLDVVTSANNEPDYGIDIGLFQDNATRYGAIYGFGKQPFGNPNLVYSSQAPFHMSFYHEAGILYRFAPALKHTFLEMRMNQFRDLAIFAFENDQPYWSWRFLGWSMHYATDATMPYHSKPLPGYSVLRLLWINLKATLGFPNALRNAIQLVSNKHTVIEAYQKQELLWVSRNQQTDHPFIIALQENVKLQEFNDSFIRNVVSKRSVDDARLFDRTIMKYFPHLMVKEPSVEVIDLPELNNVAEIIQIEDDEVREAVNSVISRRFVDYTITIRSILFSVIADKGDSSDHISG